jgi:hypothetical protein
MGQFTVLAGDFRPGDSSISGNELRLWKLGSRSTTFDAWVPARAVASVEIATEENVKRAGGTVGWGVAGALLLGPVGALGGALLGGRGKDVTFIVNLHGGRKFLAKGNSKVYEEFLKATFLK